MPTDRKLAIEDLQSQTTTKPSGSGEEKRSRKKFLIAFFTSLVFLGVISYFLSQNWVKKEPVKPSKSQRPKPEKEEKVAVPISKTEKYKIRANDVLYTLPLGFQMAIDKSWNVKILQSDQQHNFLIVSPQEGVKIEIEAILHSLKEWEEYLKRPLVAVEKTKKEKINGYKVIVQTGDETFASLKRKVITGRWKTKDKTLMIGVYSKSLAEAESLFNYLSKSVLPEKDKNVSNLRLVDSAYALTNNVPPNLPQIDYKVIEVMGEPFLDQITKEDSPYRGGFVKGYRFLAFRSQRLAIYAVEDKTSNPKSFIHSQLFDSNGEALSEEMGTYIEFKAPYTGEFFLLVYSFDQQEGRVEIRIDDHDQLGCKSFLRYPDGAELYEDPQDPRWGGRGASEVAAGYQCPAPIKLLDKHTIQFQHPMPRRPKDPPRIVTRQATEAIMSSHPDYLYKPKEGVESSFKLFVDGNYKNTTTIEVFIQQPNPNQVLITPKEGLFPKNHQVEIRPWGYRFFTQGRLRPPEIPILANILEEHEQDFTSPKGKYDFDPIEPIYIDWKRADGSKIELLAGMIQYRKDIVAEERGKMANDQLVELIKKKRRALAEEFKEFFTSKGFSVDENNTYHDPSVAVGNPWRIKEVIGLAKGNTVCKIINDTGKRFAIYCALLEE